MTQFVVNDKPAVKIFGKPIIDSSKYKSILFDCEGDKKWIPRSICKYSGDGTILVQEWWYNQNF